MKKYFVTATDTDAGKTFIGSALVSLLAQKNRVHVFKPLAAGCNWQNNQWENEDALSLQKAANNIQPLNQINPIAFKEPIAPHIAAKYHDVDISTDIISTHFLDVIQYKPDIVITEGAGGWRLPLGNGEYLSEFAKQTEQKVILVVLMKLGCLNHAILTYQSILADGLDVVGWVANCPEEMPYLKDNIELLNETISAPLLAQVGYYTDFSQAINDFDLSLLE